MAGSTSSSSNALPVGIPNKGTQYLPTYAPPYQPGHYSVSPPEVHGSLSSASGPLYGHSTMSSTSSCAGSTYGEVDSHVSANSVDFQDYMYERFNKTFNPIPLDQVVADQAKISGTLNAKQRELMELQARAQARLAHTKARFQQGARDAERVRSDLEWTQGKVASLNAKAQSKFPQQYQKARARYPSPD